MTPRPSHATARAFATHVVAAGKRPDAVNLARAYLWLLSDHVAGLDLLLDKVDAAIAEIDRGAAR